MTKLNFIINYVADAPKSAALYGKILGLQPVESSPGWAMFVIPGGPTLGLWGYSEVKPAPTASGGGSEICIEVPEDADVAKAMADWKAAGATIIQTPVELDFGLTFTATDYDGNRLRCFSSNRR